MSHMLFSPEEKASQVQSVTKELPEEQRREPVEENIWSFWGVLAEIEERLHSNQAVWNERLVFFSTSAYILTMWPCRNIIHI